MNIKSCFLIFVILVILSGESTAEFVTNPHITSIEMQQGSETQSEITVRNNWNISVYGHIYVVNVKCALECPYAHLNNSESEIITFQANESKSFIVFVRSSIFNEVRETTLGLRFENESTNDKINSTINIGQLHITIKANYGLWGGITIIPISIIIVLVFYLRRRRKKRRSEKS